MKVYNFSKRVVGFVGSFVVLVALALGVMGVDANTSHAKTKTVWKKVYLGTVKISAYSPACNTPRGSRETSTGHKARAKHTIAVNWRSPIAGYGKKLKIEGDKTIYTVEDCGNLRSHGRELDKFVDTPEEADNWGVRKRKVYLMKKVKVEVPTETELDNKISKDSNANTTDDAEAVRRRYNNLGISSLDEKIKADVIAQYFNGLFDKRFGNAIVNVLSLFNNKAS